MGISLLLLAASQLVWLLMMIKAQHSGLNELQYPEDALWSNPGDLYHLTPGLLPSPRVKNTMTYIEPLVVTMGGYSTDGSFLDDIHIYDTRVRKWSGVILKRRCCNDDGLVFESMGATEENMTFPNPITNFQGDLPAARAEHASAAYGNLVYVFGGVSEHYGLMNDLYTFDPVQLQWGAIDSYAGNAPQRRAGHSLVTDYDTGILYLFGGRADIPRQEGGSANNFTGLNDVWAFDIVAREWSWASGALPQHASGQQDKDRAFHEPAGREHAAVALMKNILFVTGGRDPASKLILNDVWAFYCHEKRWVQIQKNSGSSAGYSPPPLYHSFLAPVQHLSGGVNSTGFESTNLLLYGGVGGGGACGGGEECDQLETSFGQIYRLPINYGTYDTDNSGTDSNFASPIREGFASGSVVSPQQIRAEIGLNYLSLQGTEWSFARLSDNSDGQTFESSGNSQAGQGRLLKTWGLESVCYDRERGLLYELGGLQAVPIDMAKGNQSAREYSGPTMLDTGNHLGSNGDATGVASGDGALNVNPGPDGDGTIYLDTDAPLWDKETEQHLRTTVQLPVNTPWQYEDAFSTIAQPQLNQTVRFVQVFRTYLVTGAEAKEVTLQMEDRRGSMP